MRILIYGINFAPELTGIGKFTGELAQFLAQSNHQVRVVTSPPYYPHWKIASPYSGWRYKKEIFFGCQVIRCPIWVPNNPTGLKRLIHLASFVLSSLPVMLSQVAWKPDIVFTVAPAILGAPISWITARLTRAHAWLHIQDFEIEAAINLHLLSGFKGVISFIKKVETFWIQRFDTISTISQRMLERLWQKGIPDYKTNLLPNWVDCRTIFPFSSPSTIRDEIGASSEHIVILYSGNLGKKQGLEHLVAAAQALQASRSLLFVICGNGSARTHLEKQAANLPNIRFIDLKPVEQLNDLLNSADIHILVQRAETADLVMPSKLIGMLASGKPVIATASRGTELASVVEETGVLVPPGSLSDLTQAILSLAADKPRREKLGQLGRQFVLSHWEKELVLENFLSRLQYNTNRLTVKS